jgi:hypothetical protein
VSEKLIRGYRFVAEHDAPKRSPLYAELAAGVAGDAELIAWLDGLPDGKRQPNLLFAAYRLVADTPSGWPEFETTLKDRREEIEAVMLERRTQTNEAARCALMLPLLARLPQPLALLEVGASAGLCLLPDRYGYDYDGYRLGDGPPVLKTHVEHDPPLPTELPAIVWRAGLDLSPIDVDDDDQLHWLELLIWPGMEYRLDTLREAVAVARRDPPRLETGDLTTDDLDALAAEAPKDATLVIFHTAVLFYVPRAGREIFRAKVGRLGATWLACEGHHVLGFGDEGDYRSHMALAQDGRRVAWADGHGQELIWG